MTTESPTNNLGNGRVGFEAALAYANAELGGVNGRPLEIDYCAVLGTAESTVSCANELVDAKPVVITKVSDSLNAPGIPIVVASGIPYFNVTGGGNVETTTDGVFNFGPGTIAIWASLAKFASDQKWDRIGALVIQSASVADAFNKFGKPVFDKLGVQVNFVTFEPTAADLSPQLQTAAAGAKAVMMLGTTSNCVAGARARQTLGLTVPFMEAALCWDQTTRDALGNNGKGTYLVTDESTPLADDAEVKLFEAAMKKYRPDAKIDGVAATGFQGGMNLVKVLKQIPAGSAITKETVKAAFRATKDLPLFMKHGAKATCDGKQITGLLSVCSAGQWVGLSDGTKVTLLTDIDVAKVLKDAGL